jgi:hypothetical protein
MTSFSVVYNSSLVGSAPNVTKVGLPILVLLVLVVLEGLLLVLGVPYWVLVLVRPYCLLLLGRNVVVDCLVVNEMYRILEIL